LKRWRALTFEETDTLSLNVMSRFIYLSGSYKWFGPLSSDKLFFDSIRYRYDMRVFFSIRYDTIRYEGLKEDLLFEEFSANFRRIFRIFGEFLEFSAKKDKKIIGFENIEILDMGGSIRYTIRYTKKSDISAFDKFPIR